MPKKLNLLILLFFLFSSVPARPQGVERQAPKTVSNLETPSAYKKLTAEEFEWLLKTKGHLNGLQVVPILNKDHLQFDLGPGQFQMTIQFR
ncbi:MAG: hypothetical protein HY609_03365 [Deltaproteobacteria bacterium]|nr:hypothetical protein [Deltaproteobacteria bacterium]